MRNPQISEQWKKIESLFHDALAKTSIERTPFLDKHCGDDPALRAEVESLLASYGSEHGPLIEEVSLPRALDFFGATQMRLQPSESIGNYEILRLLGAGGMGEIYLARDLRLGRKVAIKVLPNSLSSDASLMQRFEHEAMTISSLNHPNILTIFEFHVEEQNAYMVSEFIEGVPLRELMEGITPALAIEYARQIGLALQAAHAVGIIHRDIKPENIMLRPDGLIKVLDFGIAKFVGAKQSASATVYDRLFAPPNMTVPGMLIGTVNYMSPEQIRGQPIDVRADIWSWGAVLCEMLSGHPPFAGETQSDTLANILDAEPASRCTDKRLQNILVRSLAKQADQRYQDMGTALAELNKIDLHPSRRIQFFVPRGGGLAMRAAPTLWMTPARDSGGMSTARPAVMGQWVLWAVSLAILALASIGMLRLYQVAQHQPFHLDTIVRVTNAGDVTHVGLSPDGHYIAYSRGDNGHESLHLLQIGTGADSERVPASDGSISGVTFSPDQQMLYYVVERDGNGTLYRLPTLAGSPRRMADDVDTAVTFSPDGEHYAFARFDGLHGRDALIERSISKDGERVLATIDAPRYLSTGPAWAPDGKSLLAVTYDETTPGTNKTHYLSVRVQDGLQTYGAATGWGSLDTPVFLSRDRLLITARKSGSTQAALYEFSRSKGTAEALTHESGGYRDISGNGKRFVAERADRLASLWVWNQGEAARLTETGRHLRGIAWMKQGVLLSEDELNGQSNLVRVTTQGDQPENLAAGEETDGQFATTYGGRYLVSAMYRDGGFHLWRTLQDGTQPTRLTSGDYLELSPSVSHDGKWVIFASSRGKLMSLWRVPLDGGEPVEVTARPSRNPEYSPDGRWIVCDYAEQPSDGWKVAILDASTGRVNRFVPQISGDALMHWSPDAKALLYVLTRDGTSNIWSQPLDGGSAHAVTLFKEEKIFAFAPNPDNASIAMVRGTSMTDAVLIEGSQR